MRRFLHKLQPPKERYVLWCLIIAGLLYGLFFVFLIPPWQHYDEPGHFEYAWLLANRVGLPEVGEYDQGMRREVAASMIEHNFFAGFSKPNLLAQTEPIWIGISQTNDPPLYYWLASIPLHLVRSSDITFQLYLSRLVSLVLYIVTILAAYLTVAEITRPGHALRWLVPATMIMLPGFTDLMTAVNNDVGAVAAFSLFLWMCVRVLRRPGDGWSFLGMVVFAIVCFYVKSTVLIALPLAVFVGLFALLRGRWRALAWGMSGVVILAGLLFLFRLDGASAWFNNYAGGVFVRREVTDGGYLGSRYLKLSESQMPRIAQPISPELVTDLRGETVTIGAWIWSSEPMQSITPVLSDGDSKNFEIVDVDTEPVFHSFAVKIPEEANRLTVSLRKPEATQKGNIYYDGLIMVKGDYGGSSPDSLMDYGKTIRWGEASLENLLTNPSFEQVWFQIPSALGLQLAKWLPFEPSEVLTSISDWDVSEWYYRAAFENLFRTFWAKFGWGHIMLEGQKPYRILLLATILSGMGAIAAFWKSRKTFTLDLWVFMGIALAGIWGAAIVRGTGSLLGDAFIPGARYAYPVIIFSILLLCAGWRKVMAILETGLHLPRLVTYGLFFILFLILNGLSIYSITQYYTHVP